MATNSSTHAHISSDISANTNAQAIATIGSKLTNNSSSNICVRHRKPHHSQVLQTNVATQAPPSLKPAGTTTTNKKDVHSQPATADTSAPHATTTTPLSNAQKEETNIQID